MRRLCYYSLALIAIALISTQSSTVADQMTASVNSHLNALSPFLGTFQCVDHITNENGKKTSDKTTVSYSKPVGGWIRGTVNGQTVSLFSYDPKKQKYVAMRTQGPGSYSAGYFQFSNGTVTFEYPEALNDGATFAEDTEKYTATPGGFTGTVATRSGFKDSLTCVRQ